MIPDPGADLFAFLERFVGAIVAKNWALVLGCVVLALVYGLRRFGDRLPKVGPVLAAFLKSDPGGVLLAFLGAFALTLAASPALTWAVVLASVKVAFAAMGGFAVVKKLIAPLFSWLLGKLVKAPAPAPVVVPASGAAAADIATRN